MLRRLRERNEWKFFSVLPKADYGLAAAWWVVLVLRGVLPAAFAVAMGALVGAVQAGASLAAPLALVGSLFLLLQVLTPIHQAISANLGDRTAAWLVRPAHRGLRSPPGHGTPRGSEAHDGSDTRSRFRPRHDRPAAEHLGGLHRRRSGRDDRWPGVCRPALCIRLVGPDPPRRRVAQHALAPARERRLARPQHRRRPRRAA